MSAKPEADTPRFLAWLYSPPSQQPVLAALCGIEREIAASLRPGIDHHVAHTRLQWWRAECERCAVGRPAHPLTRELRTALQEAAAQRLDEALAGLTGLVDAAAWDLAGATFEKREELAGYCRRWAVAMLGPLQSALPSGDAAEANPSQSPAAGDWTGLGAALREIELLGDLARDARQGRLRLPLDELEQAAVAPRTLATPPWPESLVRLLRARHEALRRSLAAIVSGFPPASQKLARGMLVWAALASRESALAQRALPYPSRPSAASAAAANWRAWRAARAAAAGRSAARMRRWAG